MQLLSVGYNKGNLLCRNGNPCILSPVEMIPDLDRIICLSLGFCKGLVVYDNGLVLAWGDKFSEMNPNKSEDPYIIKELSNIKYAKSGRIFDMFLDKEGNVFYLALLSSTITKIEIDEPIIGIYGYEKAFVVGESGALYQIDNVSQTAQKIDFLTQFIDFYGGEEFLNDKIRDVLSIRQSVFILTEKKRVFCQGQFSSVFTKFVELDALKNKNIIKIDGMYGSIAALSENGEVYVNGLYPSQVGLGEMDEMKPGQFVKLQFQNQAKIIDIALSHAFSLFLDENGIVWSTGDGSDGSIIQGKNVSCSIPTKVTSIEEPVSRIYCGSCFTYIQIGGDPHIAYLQIEEDENKKRLSINGIDYYLSFSNSDEFHFLFTDRSISVNRLFADFISPKVAQLHFIDPTIESLIITTEKDDSEQMISSFNKIIQIAQGQNIGIDDDELSILVKLSRILSNDELIESIFESINNDLNMSNVFSIAEFELNRFSDLSKQTRKFIAENFYEILKKKQDEFGKLEISDDLMFDILSDQNLVIDDEDTLYIFIMGLISKEKNNLFLLECIEFQLLSQFYIHDFVSSLYIDDIKGFLLKKLVRYLMPSDKQFSKGKYKRRYHKMSIT